MSDEALRARREVLVREHIATEERRDFAATLKTFRHPRYEIVPTGEVLDGDVAVKSMLEETRLGFPDFHFVGTRFHHADAAIFVETEFHGTHLGAWRGLPATGRAIAYKMCNVFEFDGDELVCERLYFDLLTALRQLGIARDPTSLVGRIATFVNHPVVIGSALVDDLRARLSSR